MGVSYSNLSSGSSVSSGSSLCDMPVTNDGKVLDCKKIEFDITNHTFVRDGEEVIFAVLPKDL
jgi:hypothetical protein